MLGVLITLLFCLGLVGLGRFFLHRWTDSLDPAFGLSVCGVVAIGATGLLTLCIGLIPNGFQVGLFVVLAASAFGLFDLWRNRSALKLFSRKPISADYLFLAIPVFCVLIALVCVLAPSNQSDWDTIAYHLAVPKLYLAAGHIYPISFIHHSNFPQSVDLLYVWGLIWGDQQGAKAFQLAFYLLGILGVFGLGRFRYGTTAGAWAALTFATVPVILMEAGTAYIDIAHGLYAGFGAVIAILSIDQRKLWPLAALCLGFAVGSKYTGLQTVFAVGVSVLLLGVKPIGFGKAFSAAALISALALVIGAPWYLKNASWTGNPVYPFFFEKFGGKNWDQFGADIYREEQQTFGVPRSGPAAGIASLPAAVLGLAYQPGRYINPDQRLRVENGIPLGAQGFPLGAVGVPILAAALLWAFSGRLSRFETGVLVYVGVSLLMWFVLTQQSRYIISLAPPLAALAGGAIARLRAGRVLVLAGLCQAAVTIYWAVQPPFSSQIPAAFGAVSKDEYLTSTFPFYSAAKYMNANIRGGKVALFNEVFGYYLDVPYYWANPGHSTEIPYAGIQTGAEFAAALKRMGFSHVYLKLPPRSPDTDRWIAAMGLRDNPIPYSPEEAKGMDADLRNKWRRLLADAVASRTLEPVQSFRGGILFRLRKE